MVDRVDVVVIGGGLAGVTAARDLAQGGFHTALVEARDRLGGRTASQSIAGRDVDTGGTYFHWFQAAIWTEVQRYELDLAPRPDAERFVIGIGGQLVEMAGEELDERLRRALRLFWADPEYIAAFASPYAIQNEPGVVALDSRSVDARLREIHLDPVDEDVLRAAFTDFGRPLHDVSLAWVLQRAANAVWSYEAFNALFAVYRLSRGIRGLIDAMVLDGGFDVRLASPVVAVRDVAAGPEVRIADGSTIQARSVVLATPVNVWRTIDFTPPLPELHQQAAMEGVTAPDLSTAVMHVRGVPESINMLAPYGDQPFDFMFTYDRLEDGQLISGYSMNGSVTCSGSSVDPEAALERILPEAELVDFVGHDWGPDPYALGGSGSLQVGQLTRLVDVLDRPNGRLFIASGDVSPHFPGFLTGAIEAGARAAHRAKIALRG